VNGTVVTTPDQSVSITTGGSRPVVITSPDKVVKIGTGGLPGPVGPPGPMGPSGTTVVAVPYDQWPPADPQPNTLYLRLAP
jgi:hypothetical protein